MPPCLVHLTLILALGKALFLYHFLWYNKKNKKTYGESLMILKSISQSMHKGPIYVLGVIGCLIFLCLGVACSNRDVIKEPAPAKNWTCSREADEAMKRNDYQEAIRLHQKILDTEPDNALALYHLGYAYGQLANHEQEVLFYERAAALGFQENYIFFNMGMAYGELNRIDKSIESFQKALQLDPNSAENHFGLALAFQRSVQDRRAEEEFLKAIELDPAHMESRLYLSMLYADRGEMQKAASQLREVLKIDPSNSGAREFLKRIEGE
jgi:tetratricopeptide (TPR) repeat protein